MEERREDRREEGREEVGSKGKVFKMLQNTVLFFFCFFSNWWRFGKGINAKDPYEQSGGLQVFIKVGSKCILVSNRFIQHRRK